MPGPPVTYRFYTDLAAWWPLSAVFLHDAVDYMADEEDLRRAIETAFVHCRPGGIAVFVPDQTQETFEECSSHGGSDGPDGRGVRYLDWTWDPDPPDSWSLTEYVFLLWNADRSVDVVHETHQLGLFGRDQWLRLLAEVGFDWSPRSRVSSAPPARSS